MVFWVALLALLGIGGVLTFTWHWLFSMIWTPIVITGLALLYLWKRWDIIPDFIPYIGWADDLFVGVIAVGAWLLYIGLNITDWFKTAWADPWGKALLIGVPILVLAVGPRLFGSAVRQK
jgi:hypothetical protein